MNDMLCSEMVEKAKVFLQDVKSAKKLLSASSAVGVNSQEEKRVYEDLASRWFSDLWRRTL